MNDDRKLYLFGKLQLADEPLSLQFIRFRIPVVIQTDFSDSHDLFPAGQFLHPLDFFLCQFSHMIRMDSHRAVDKRIFFRKFYRGRHTRKLGSHVHDR